VAVAAQVAAPAALVALAVAFGGPEGDFRVVRDAGTSRRRSG
jgi:hypothetical protein